MSASDFHFKVDASHSVLGYMRRAERTRTVPWPFIVLLLAAFDAILFGTLAIATGQAYYWLTFDDLTHMAIHIRLGASIAFLVVAMSAIMGGYRLTTLMRQPFQPGRLASVLLASLLILLAMLFLTKSSEHYSRSVISITFAVGFPAFWLLRRLEAGVLRNLAQAGRLEVQRLLLIGTPERIDEIATNGRLQEHGLEIAGRVALRLWPGHPDFDFQMRRISETARYINPDRVVLCLPWSERKTLEACVARLAELPAAISLDSDPYLRSLAADQSGPFDNPVGLQIIGRPFSQTHLAVKRSFDVAVATFAVALAAPVMLIVALLIKLDSPGPVLFRQKRYGYNRSPFRIFKFRTMTNGQDKGFRQAARNDARITRVGRFLRKTNLDELPQLFNVIAGDMSLVGPRPHPTELDDQFSPLITHYSRRHRVRPGITGWAQVNGYRGETDTTEKMQGRLAYDLHYLNNWSFWLDIRILLMTVISASAYRNAF